MSEIEIPQTRLSDPQDDEVTRYQAVSGLAVTGLILALLAPAALAHPLLWILPVVAIVICLVALERIAEEAPALVGRKVALAGLMLALLCGAAAPSQWFAYRRMLDAEAGQFAAQWFEFLRRNEPHKAMQLTEYPNSRLPLDDKLWEFYSPSSEARQHLLHYVRKPEIRSLLFLGGKAHVQYYDTEKQERGNNGQLVKRLYAVTYDEGGRKKSFFVGITLERQVLASTGQAYWRVLDTTGGIRPQALGGEPDQG